MQVLPEVYRIAIDASIEAANDILEIYTAGFDTIIKADGSPVTEADLKASNTISRHLEKTGIPIIGEEREKTPYEERKHWTENWCVDPLDGTKEFVKRNGEFCINIAHVQNGKPVFGLINEPCKKRIIFGGSTIGVYLLNYGETDSEFAPVKIDVDHKLSDTITWIGSRSHANDDSKWVEMLSKTFGVVEKISKGSAIKFFDLAFEEAQIYPRFAPTMEWDIAAGQAILEALGGSVISAETGLPMVYNKESLFNHYFIAKTRSFIAHEEQVQSSLNR